MKRSPAAWVRADVTRLRTGIEGTWPWMMGGTAIEPTAELGLRYDGGDAENGIGMDIGGGLSWTVPSLGLTLDVSGRTLLAHQDSGFKESGFSAGLLLEPGSGPSLNLRREFGGAARGGVESLFTPSPTTTEAGALDEGRGAWRPAGALPCSTDGSRVARS